MRTRVGELGWREIQVQEHAQGGLRDWGDNKAQEGVLSLSSAMAAVILCAVPVCRDSSQSPHGVQVAQVHFTKI